MATKWVVFDLEADGLRPTKIYCLCWRDYEGNRGAETDFGRMGEFFRKYEVYVGHNIRRFDIPRCVRDLLGINPEGIKWVDTIGLSWYLFPERKGYSLASFGPDYGFEKVKIDDWFNLSVDEYIERCSVDVDINYALWKDCLTYLVELYGKDNLWGILKYLDFKLYCAHLAEESRWKVDVDQVKEGISELDKLREEKFEELRDALPKIPVVKEYEPPKRLRNADGQLSVLGQRWQDRLREAGLPPDHEGTVRLVVDYVDGNPNSPEQVKNWLFSLGWKPRKFKYKKDKDGKDKAIPQINSEPGELCESVTELAEDHPSVLALEGYSVISHRLGLLRGFLSNLSEDGYLTAAVAGLTNTLRFKHTEIVNLPKPEKKFAAHVRGSLVARKGKILCGADMSSLEDRLKQHFIYPYDPEYVNELNKEDYDPHLDLALLAGALTPEEVEGYKKGEKSYVAAVKPIRSIYKNGNYACQYGAGVAKLALTCGCDRDTAKRVHETYWKRNWAIKAVADAQKIKTVRGQMWLYNPISKFWYSLRDKKDVFSTLVQGSAVYCFDCWVREIVSKRPQLTGQFHDEIIIEVKEGHDEAVHAFLEETISCVNKELKLNRELGIGIQFGKRYSEIH